MKIYLLLNRNTYRFDFIERNIKKYELKFTINQLIISILRSTYKSLLIEVIFDQNRVILNVIELQGDEEFTTTNRS